MRVVRKVPSPHAAPPAAAEVPTSTAVAEAAAERASAAPSVGGVAPTVMKNTAGDESVGGGCRPEATAPNGAPNSVGAAARGGRQLLPGDRSPASEADASAAGGGAPPTNRMRLTGPPLCPLRCFGAASAAGPHSRSQRPHAVPDGSPFRQSRPPPRGATALAWKGCLGFARAASSPARNGTPHPPPSHPCRGRHPPPWPPQPLQGRRSRPPLPPQSPSGRRERSRQRIGLSPGWQTTTIEKRMRGGGVEGAAAKERSTGETRVRRDFEQRR